MPQQPCPFSTTFFCSSYGGFRSQIVSMAFLGPWRRTLSKTVWRMSKFHLVKKWWGFENHIFWVWHPFCCCCSCFSRHVFPDFFQKFPFWGPHNLEFFFGFLDFFQSFNCRRLVNLGICIAYGPGHLTFSLLPIKLKKKNFPSPQLRIFFRFPRFFSKC